MREIKFRAWDKKEKRMIFNEELIIPTVNGENCLLGDILFIYPDEDYELMQYTGLHSKNGEIYEGDIIRDGKNGSKYNGGIGFVEYVTNNSQGHPINGYWYRSSKDEAGTIFPKDVEIIGNIWENPELLNK